MRRGVAWQVTHVMDSLGMVGLGRYGVALLCPVPHGWVRRGMAGQVWNRMARNGTAS